MVQRKNLEDIEMLSQKHCAQNLCDAAKGMFRGKFTTLNSYMNKLKDFKSV